MRIVSEAEFRERISDMLLADNGGVATAWEHVGAVTGPGRSGAIAAVYASHILRVPFIPYGAFHPAHLGRLLIIDTARLTGATLRKAARKYQDADPIVMVCFEEPPRVAFWYESTKPQHYRHEFIATPPSIGLALCL